jgi:AraC family transcriptional regulator
MLRFDLPAGTYAVFVHKGGPSKAAQTFQYILTEWLPGSEYVLDQRPHFEVLGEKYKHNDPEAEEEIWLPVMAKSINS